MAALSRLAACLALASCYSPELRDCTVACATDSDCGGDQVCGTDRMCASPDLAGRCQEILTPDAMGLDARPFDAALPADAKPDGSPPFVTLVVEIDGPGVVDAIGIAPCSDLSPGHRCEYLVIANIAVELHAVPKPDKRFEKWEDACAGTNPICTVTPAMAMTKVKARFRND